ncbi:MAG TPA: redoxin domain-containing protein [Thermoanaerobaculia bacterium]|nr:redoxin domain-containing protein [Thermoanaerobaculia bacterium]
MPPITVPLHVPELAPGTWVQGPPVSMGFARGAVVLVEFWEATCVNCLRTLPYLVEWHRRYASRGLVVVGVHTPEFEMTRQPDTVAAAVAAEGIPYPVLLDPVGETWRRFANKGWPSRFLADARGYLRYEHLGEGAYGETERFLQKLLREAGDERPMPEPMAPLRAEDRPGAVCLRPTAELYLGYHRGRLAGTVPFHPHHEVDHPPQPLAELPDGTFLARGRWLHEAEYLECRQAGGELEVAFTAGGANLVVEPPSGGEGELEVLLVDEGGACPLPEALRGGDVGRSADSPGGGSVARARWDRPRMLALLDAPDLAPRRLLLRFTTPGARAYAVSFVGRCVEPPPGPAAVSPPSGAETS